MVSQRPKHYATFRRPRNRAIRSLNNIHVINNTSRKALVEFRTSVKSDSGTKINFEIPVLRGDKVIIARRRSEILKLIDSAISRDLYGQAMISAIAVTEDYLIQMVSLLLRWYPEKLSVRDRKVDVSIVVDVDDLEELKERIIEKQVNAAFYESPEKYFRYIEDVLAITIPQSVKDKYSEVKASRDVLVHNFGVINRLYLKKAGSRARGGEGDNLPLDDAYLDQTIRSLKAVVVAVYNGLLTKYGKVK